MSAMSRLFLVLVSTLALTACETPDHYPVSGQECGPEDPVLDVDASMADCMPDI